MANGIFNPCREGFLVGEIDWDTAVFKLMLVRSYTFSAAHKFVSDVTGAGGVVAATSAALASKTATSGVADAADLATTFPSVASNASGHGILVVQASAVAGGGDVAATAQRVVVWMDTGTNLPVTPNGGNINVAFNASGIFSI